jgi:2-oxoglutarate ferredoxin oxidoreductase subunit beta
MIYIVMNNGCYGLTKGQDSATADIGSTSKAGSVNAFEPIDLASIALQLGASFVARSFSGDKDQLVPLIKAAISHQGFALIDVVSPCVTFNNNPGSTKNYAYVRDHLDATSTMDFVPIKEQIKTHYDEGDSTSVTMHDGSEIKLNKLSQQWDPFDRQSALNAIAGAKAKDEILTGLLYIDADSQDLHSQINTNKAPLRELDETVLCPSSSVLANINAGLR